MKVVLKLSIYLILVSVSGFSFAEGTDHDGLSDTWERTNGRDPLVADYMLSAARYQTFALVG